MTAARGARHRTGSTPTVRSCTTSLLPRQGGQQGGVPEEDLAARNAPRAQGQQLDDGQRVARLVDRGFFVDPANAWVPIEIAAGANSAIRGPSTLELDSTFIVVPSLSGRDRVAKARS